jgi:quercetin dioxygenase-like cupin family protein
MAAATHVISRNELPGSDRARDFVGEEFGVGVTIILLEMPPGRGPSLHRHPYEEIFVVHEGSGTFRVGDAEVEAGAGDVVVVPARTPHGFVNSGDGRLWMTAIHHAPKFSTEWLERD